MEKDTVKMSSHFFYVVAVVGGGGVKWTADEDFSSSFFPSRVCVCVCVFTQTHTSVRTIFLCFFF